jgi:hypothetical protein
MFIHEPTAQGAVPGVSPGEGMGKHSEVQKLSSILFMSWTVFDVMRMREYRLWLNIKLCFILKGSILLFTAISLF